MALKKDSWKLSDFPCLKNYIDGIGAEQLSFKRYLIKDYVTGSYYVEKHYITITEEGEINCPDEYKPSEALARQIKEEIESKRDKWPSVIAFGEIQLREFLKEQNKNTTVYRFYVRGSKLAKLMAKKNAKPDENMIMLQVRYNNEDGGKTYKPWSYFNDGVWRSMECDEKIPFFKPAKKSNTVNIMLHEGPKAAAAAQTIADEYLKGNRSHPWAKELSKYEHWGVMGGALATHRCDYNELIEEKATEVVYMCDNDKLGENSVPVVSRCYGRKMSVISFDKRWKPSWDIADPLPAEFFDENKKYIGPNLNSLIHPATWATKEIPSTGNKKAYDLTDAFMSSWIFCVSPKLFINVDKPSYYHTEENFNDLVKHVSHVKKTSELLIDKFSTKVDTLMYDPGHPPGKQNKGTNKQDNRVKFNMHVAPTIELVKIKNGNDKLWHDYLEHMFPEENNRHEMKRWIATLIARPDIKINYAVLLISEQQGVGKSTLASYILAPLLGENNVSYPESSAITESKFTSWQVRKRLAVINEIYEGHSYKAYNRLKSVITEPTVTVEEKYQPTYDIQNWCHIFACSNDERAIKFTRDDRRWLIPTVTEKKWGSENWDKFHAWLKADGLGIIKQWCYDFIAEDPKNVIRHGEESPDTARKQQVYETTLSDGEKVVLERMKELREEFKDPFYVTIQDLRKFIAINYDPSKDPSMTGSQGSIDDFKMSLQGIEPSYRIKKLLKGSGFYSNSKQIRINGELTLLISNDEIIQEIEVGSQLESKKIDKIFLKKVIDEEYRGEKILALHVVDTRTADVKNKHKEEQRKRETGENVTSIGRV